MHAPCLIKCSMEVFSLTNNIAMNILCNVFHLVCLDLTLKSSSRVGSRVKAYIHEILDICGQIGLWKYCPIYI